MGVPKFYRWLSERYPQINQILSGTTILPEFDNFYLDMNGIIHACTHPNEDTLANSLTNREMMLAIFRYIDHIITEIVKPKKILFMAIDGVAPRAKLNQQRARRFRAAQAQEESITKARQKGETIDEEKIFDSNCITPGTAFMEMVGIHLRYFIRKKIKEDPLWRNLKIVFSGHDVPGEGEHKIMQFIRDLRADVNYEPNQRHCMYGQDADLIMLGLATHEPHFALLREVVNFNSFGPKQTTLRQSKSAQFQLLHLSILREYLSLDFACESNWLPDQERLIDDFILLTFLVGNDFLPHLPTLDISEHAFDLLIRSYRSLMNEEPGYIVCDGEIKDLPRLEKLFKIIGSQESSILKSREDDVKAFNKKRRKFKDVNALSVEEFEEEEEERQLAFDKALALAMGNISLDTADEDIMIETEEEWISVSKPLSTSASKIKSGSNLSTNDDSTELIVNKDYRGRYYYEKYKVIVNSNAGESFLSELRMHYLQGLIWCLAYYIKGCISWTWYYPYHYGPMLQDMIDLTQIKSTINFHLGSPFTPFQQLLGCLPPASSRLLPRPYQWLMVSIDSPVLHFYPVEFGIDQDGKKNPWEAVVLLDFIDEVKLLAAEALYCPPSKLTKTEIARNKFGSVLTVSFEPGVIDTYPSCNPEIGLSDIYCCQSIAVETKFSLEPGFHFKAELTAGTTFPIAGFPSLTVLPLVGVKTEFTKLNMFGSESKYQSLILEIKSLPIDSAKNFNLELLLGRIVYVNYPQVLEAKVIAVSTEDEEVRIQSTNTGDAIEIKRTIYDAKASKKWKDEALEEESKYLKGRGTPGSGGLTIGPVLVRLRVAALQGLERNPITGASKKVYASQTEADVPIQMALWVPPVLDTRFQETAELSVRELMPYGSEVIALAGQLIGCKGKIVGPHKPDEQGSNEISNVKKSSLKSDTNKLLKDTRSSQRRLVDVEFTITPPEPSFGYAIANSVKEEFYSSKDLCSLLKITPSVLGKIVGMIRVEPGKQEIGLNLKRNGQYQLLGYCQKVENSSVNNQSRQVWTGIDTVEVVGVISDETIAADKAAEADAEYWQYSARAAALIFDYKTQFPMLFSQLAKLPHSYSYTANQIFGNDGERKVEEVLEWMKAQPFYKLARTPFSTASLSRDAIIAIEKAADEQIILHTTSKEKATIVVKDIPIESVFCDAHYSVGNVALPYNFLEPKLGDRVVNLTNPGTPFGFKGTIVTIHSKTKYVEVVFDQEFIGGKGLQGACSAFRGRLCPWTDLLLVSRQNEYREFKKNNATMKIIGKDNKKTMNIIPAKSMLKKEDLVSIPLTQATTSAPATTNDRKNSDNLGQTLLKILKKEEKPTHKTFSDEDKLKALKPDTDIAIQETSAKAIPVTSNGSGVQILAQAAGYSISDVGNQHTLLPSTASMLSHNVLMGVISYQAKSSALSKNSLTSAPIISTVVNASNGKSESKVTQENSAALLVIDKEAAHRIVTRNIHSAPNKKNEKSASTTQPKTILKRNSTDSNELVTTSQTKSNDLMQLLKKTNKQPVVVKEGITPIIKQRAGKTTTVKEDVTISLASKVINAKNIQKADEKIINEVSPAIVESVKTKDSENSNKTVQVLKDSSPPPQSLMSKLLNAKKAMKESKQSKVSSSEEDILALNKSPVVIVNEPQSIKDKLANAKKLMKEKQFKQETDIYDNKQKSNEINDTDVSTKEITPKPITSTTAAASSNSSSIVSLLIKAKTESVAKAASIDHSPDIVPVTVYTPSLASKASINESKTSKEKASTFLVPSKVIITKPKL